MRIPLLLTLIFSCSILLAQPDTDPLNAELIAHVELTENGNDIWGYVDENGTEYAIMGGASNTYIWSLEDIENPILRAQIPGTTTIWRDMKVWEDHIYVTTDNSSTNTIYDGLLIVDMSQAPDTITHNFIKPSYDFSGESEDLGSCHNIYIDEEGFAYLAGCNVGVGGIIILDLKQDKDNPPYVGNVNARYAHDVYVRDTLMYTSDIFDGIFSVYNINDRSNPEFINGASTSNDFTHNAWLSDDGDYLFTTDERGNAYVDAWDISDLDNLEKVDRWQPLETRNRGVIPHNTHYYNGYLVTSWYTDGLRVIDAHKPDNLVEIAKYDTWDGPDGDFFGCWGAYPFLPSGKMLASDINSGLYIIDVDFKRAAYLEGKVTAAATGEPLVNTSVVIQSTQTNSELSGPSGSYKTGQVATGTFDVVFDNPNYNRKTVSATLVSGEVTELDVELEQSKLEIFVYDADGNPIPEAGIFVNNPNTGLMSELNTNDEGKGELGVRSFETYNVEIAAWGHKPTQISVELLAGAAQVQVSLQSGYADDFFSDLGWTIETTASSGGWTRAVPFGVSNNGQEINPGSDDANDIGAQAFVTGNAQVENWFEDDIDNGFTQITSPVMDWSTASEANISFSTWFFIGGDGTPDDSLSVYISNGTDEVRIHNESAVSNSWTKQEMTLTSDAIDFTDNMSLRVFTSDEGTGNIVEAGFDALSITLNNVNNSLDIDEEIRFTISPNPAIDKVYLDIENISAQKVIVTDLLGRTILDQAYTNSIDISDWNTGIYLVQIATKDFISAPQKLVKK